MKSYCPNCENDNLFSIIEKEETFPVRREEVKVISRVKICDICKEEIFDETLDNENLIKAYNMFRKKKGILFPQDVKAIRQKYELSQRGMAKLLGWSQPTIARYEGGAIPSSSHNEQLIMLRDNPGYATNRLEDIKDMLSSCDKRRVSKITHKYLNEELNKVIEGYYNHYHSTILSGFKRFDFEKLSNVAVFYAENMLDLVKTKLMKLLWFTDFAYYHRYKISMTGTPYWHHHYGPVPIHHDLLVSCLVENNIIETKPIQFDYCEGDRVIPCAQFDPTIFNEDEIDVLKAVLQKFKEINATTISTMSHEEDGYSKTVHKEVISYGFARNLKHIQ